MFGRCPGRGETVQQERVRHEMRVLRGGKGMGRKGCLSNDWMMSGSQTNAFVAGLRRQG